MGRLVIIAAVAFLLTGCSASSRKRTISDWDLDQYYRKVTPAYTKQDVVTALGHPDGMCRRVETGRGSIIIDGKAVEYTDFSVEHVDRLNYADLIIYFSNSKHRGEPHARYEFEWHGDVCVTRVDRIKLVE